MNTQERLGHDIITWVHREYGVFPTNTYWGDSIDDCPDGVGFHISYEDDRTQLHLEIVVSNDGDADNNFIYTSLFDFTESKMLLCGETKFPGKITAVELFVYIKNASTKRVPADYAKLVDKYFWELV